MTDAFERNLRADLAAHAQSLPTAPVVERLARIDYQPRTQRGAGSWLPVWVPVWPALTGAAAVLAAAVVAVVLLLSSGTPAAYAGWTPNPTTPTSAAVAAATASCNRNHFPVTGRTLLTDARGKYTAVLYPLAARTIGRFHFKHFVGVCISDGSSISTSNGRPPGPTPGPDQIEAPSGGGGTAPGFGATLVTLPPEFQQQLKHTPNARSRAVIRAAFSRLLGHSVESNAFAKAGNDIATVTLIFPGGAKVEATVQNGWYFAWWPSLAKPASVSVRTKTGRTINARMACSAIPTGCMFATSSRPRLLLPTQASRTSTATGAAPNVPTQATATTPTVTTAP